MKKVRDIEEHSGPRHMSSATSLWTDRELKQELPMHHYVDYFVGTNTGGSNAFTPINCLANDD